MKPDAVIFDLDDTLYDYLEYRHSGFRAVADFLHESEQLPRLELYRQILQIDKQCSPIHPKPFNELISHYGFPRSRLKEMIEIYRNHKPAIRPFPDAIETLISLRSLSVPMFLLTEGTKVSQQTKIEALNIQDFFEEIFILTPPANHKGQPHIFNKVMQVSGAPASRIWVVGDNPKKDFAVPLKIGMPSFHIKRGVYKHHPSPGGCYTLRSLREMEEHCPHLRRIKCTATK